LIALTFDIVRSAGLLVMDGGDVPQYKGHSAHACTGRNRGELCPKFEIIGIQELDRGKNKDLE